MTHEEITTKLDRKLFNKIQNRDILGHVAVQPRYPIKDHYSYR